MAKIDLGTKYPSHPEVATSKGSSNKTSYPSFHVTGKAALHSMPDEFQAHGHFKIVHRSKGKRTGEPETYSHEVEVHHLTPARGSGKGSAKSESGSDLDDAFTKIEEKKAKKAGKHVDPDNDGD